MNGAGASEGCRRERLARATLVGTVVGLVLAFVLPAGQRVPAPPSSSPSLFEDAQAMAEPAARALLPPGLELRAATASEAPGVFVGVASSGAIAWWAATTRLLPRQTPGYAGPIDLLVGLSLEGRITGVRVLGHRETPTFVSGLEEPWFLDQFVGKTAADPLEPGVDFDGITHATVTIEAVAADLREILRSTSASLLPRVARTAPRAATAAPARTAWTLGETLAAIPLSGWCLAIALGAIAAGHRLPRPVSDLLVILLLGVLTQQFLSLSHLPIVFAWRRQGALPPPMLLTYLVIAAMIALASARGYCRFLCPMGRLQDLIATGARLTDHQPFTPPAASAGAALVGAAPVGLAGAPSAENGSSAPQGVPAHTFRPAPAPSSTTAPPAPGPQPAPDLETSSPCRVRPLGRWLAWGALAALAAGLAPPLENLEIFTPLFLRRGGVAGLLLVVAALAGAALAPRFYCRGLCPLNPLFEDLETARRLLTRREEPHEPPSVPR
jgi:electron transport complex protein RnfG